MTKDITRSALTEALLSSKPPIVVEALPRKNFASGHIPTALPLPLDELAKLAPQLSADLDQAIVVYCSGPTCRNSHQAAEFLAGRGYRNVGVYGGGKQDWVEAGLRLDA